MPASRRPLAMYTSCKYPPSQGNSLGNAVISGEMHFTSERTFFGNGHHLVSKLLVASKKTRLQLHQSLKEAVRPRETRPGGSHPLQTTKADRNIGEAILSRNSFWKFRVYVCMVYMYACICIVTETMKKN
jgi:hypothetical protein